MKIKNILLIDDNDVDTYINKYVLKQVDIAESIVAKSSAIDALEYLKGLREDFPEIIFLDIRMPEMDGFGFLEKYSEFPETKKEHCRIIMLTSSNDAEDMKRAASNPYVKKYLNKPLSSEMLAGIIE